MAEALLGSLLGDAEHVADPLPGVEVGSGVLDGGLDHGFGVGDEEAGVGDRRLGVVPVDGTIGCVELEAGLA